MNNLQLNQQQLSYISASILMMGFFVFLLGYYLGRYNYRYTNRVQEEQSIIEPDIKELLNEPLDIIETPSEAINISDKNINKDESIAPEQNNKEQVAVSSYKAELITYDRLEKARNFEHRNKKFADVITIKREGPKKTQYQNIVLSINKEELIEQTELIKKSERLKTIKILAINENQKSKLLKNVS